MRPDRRAAAAAVCITAAALTLAIGPADATRPPADGAAPLLLLYYDDHPAGELYAKALHNWLGHFRLRVVRAPVERYRRQDLRDASFIAYIGASFDNPFLPAAFLDDVAAGSRPVLWMHYNIWKLLARGGASRLGFAYELTDDGGEFTAVRYKGVLLPRDGRTDLVRVRPLSSEARVPAVAVARSGQTAPYALWSRHLLYIADPVFSFLANGDRSLVLADILHDFLGQIHGESRDALIRIEDVHPLEQVARLQWIGRYLADERVPYAVSVIPAHVDETGRVTRLSDPSRAPMVRAIRQMIGDGARIMLHGYTHQHDGRTPHDWEFWDVRAGRPVNDSEEWAAARVRRGVSELAAVNLRADGWVTPHYMAAEAHYRAFARLFPVAYERQFLFSERAGGILLFYPYAAADIFGRWVIPENLESPREVGSTREMLATADRLKVVRCGVASFYIHVDQVRQHYRELVGGLKGRGLTFVGTDARSPIWRHVRLP